MALESEGITATGPVAVTDLVIEHGEQFRFTAEFTELPDFDLPDYGGFALKSDTDRGMRDEISKLLLEKTALDVPDELIRQELSFDGVDESKPSTKEWAAAHERVKLLLILDRIASRDGIMVDDRDVEERIDRIASAHGTKPRLLKQQLLRSGGMSRLTRFIAAERTLDYLIDICRG
jgi:FKBP-type peptidyl-prolyl cis-trans isomerase (trigger factor)